METLNKFWLFFLCYFVGCLCACRCALTLSKTYNLVESSLSEFYKKSGPNNFWSVAESVSDLLHSKTSKCSTIWLCVLYQTAKHTGVSPLSLQSNGSLMQLALNLIA